MEVATSLSFSKASRVLFISQPAISKHIKVLEQYYKQSLFERKGNNISLTEAGKILFAHLKNAKNIQEELEFELSTLENKYNARGELKLGASTTVALYIIPKILSGFHQKYPELMISLLNRNTDTIVKALLNEDIDIGIVEGKKKMSTIIYQPFMSDEVVAVCSSKSEIAKKRTLTIKEFLQKPVALREQGSGTLEAVKDCFEKNGIKMQDLKTGIRLAGTEALKNFIREDNCIGFLPKGSIKRELKDGDLVSIRIEKIKIERNFFFIQRQGTQNNELNRSFIRFCKQHL